MGDYFQRGADMANVEGGYARSKASEKVSEAPSFHREGVQDGGKPAGGESPPTER
jgi:hypothetical protein